MTKDEFDKKLTSLKEAYDKSVKVVWIEYAMSHNVVKEGDIIEDKKGVKIRVDSIKVSRNFEDQYTQCVYHGVILLANGKENKKRNRYSIYFSDLKQ